MAPAGSIGRPIPDTWSPWLALWDDQGWRQRASSQVEFFLMNKPCDLPHLRWHPICEGIKLWKMTRNKICNIVILHGNSSVVIGWKGKSKIHLSGLLLWARRSHCVWGTSFKTSLRRRTASWRWSCLGQRRLWWRRGWDRRRLDSG